MRGKREKREKSHVMKIPPSAFKTDETERPYFPYCGFGFHRGVILVEEICLKRTCQHYHRVYLEDLT